MKDLLHKFESGIRSNKLAEVREQINDLSLVSIPRNYAAAMANVALRSGALFWAFRLLNPIIRSDSNGIQASPEEKAEYAFILHRIGAHQEAQRILQEIIHLPLPKVHMYMAAIHVNAWDYISAMACFEKYLSFSELTAYEQMVGRLNLANCMVGSETRMDEAGTLLEWLRKDLCESKNSLLHGNSVELTIQYYFKLKNFSECEKWITKGKEIFPEVNSTYALFLKKWTAILKIQNQDPAGFQLMNEVKAEAFRMQHHETMREADFYVAIAKKDESLFNKVYFGTPWPKYRERMLKHKPDEIQLQKTYEYSPLAQDSRAPLLSVGRVKATANGKDLKSGQLLHRVLVSLTSDLYRPMWVAAIYTSIFPNEFFHPEAGPKRVHQAVFRLRNWFAEAGIPLEIQETNGRYSLEWKAACRIELHFENIQGALQGVEATCGKMIQLFQDNEFGTKDVSRKLDISPTLARQALKWGVENHMLLKIGTGPKTRYKKSG